MAQREDDVLIAQVRCLMPGDDAVRVAGEAGRLQVTFGRRVAH